MNRREFLVANGLAVGGAAISAAGVAATVDSSLQAVESSALTLTPQSSDQWELRFTPNRPLRVLQVTDTHFSSSEDKDRSSVQTLDLLIQRTEPDLIVHTGDMVNNDSKRTVTWGGVDYFNKLNRPWALCFGNHDHPVAKSRGSLTLDDYRKSLRNCALGFSDANQERHYCYRHDLMGRGDAPLVSLFYFQVGHAARDRKISAPQLDWFGQQIKADEHRGWAGSILVFVHIPLMEYDALAARGEIAGGVINEKVCFDGDAGDSFRAFAASRRVTGVFCGHDHVNNYYGDWQGIGLHYGRVSGWGGYGDWARGGRLISVDPATGAFTQHEVVV